VNDADMIVCWKHNWPECPLEVLELSKLVGGDKPETYPAAQKRGEQPRPVIGKTKPYH